MKKKIFKKLNYFLAILLFVCGLAIYLYPTISSAVTSYYVDNAIEKAESLISESQSASDSGGSEFSAELDELYRDMLSYNEQIYEQGQSGLCDAWSYEQSAFDLASYGISGAIGVLRIPAMNDLEMPLYLGASSANMAYGAAQLGQTSMPIGGENTNCVIAGHRGYGGMAYFLYIENLQIGDMVYIDNPWGTLAYKVSEIKVIQPDDIDSILIREGEDMVTLITCHPYPYNYTRYAVFCTRTELDDDGSPALTDTESGKSDVNSSKFSIFLDYIAYYVFAPLFIALLIFFTIFLRRGKRR